MTHAEQMQADQALIEAYLAEYLDTLWPFGKLVDAMSYSLLGGGKRIRPVLCLAACRFCGGEIEKALPLACALEMIHTYSLIHDDLPCMDDDDLRRGKPTNHKMYGQANAVLAGDALLTAAFEHIAKEDALSAEQRVSAIVALAEASGPSGMVAGQILDMEHSGRLSSIEQIKTIEALKTGKLMLAAVQLGCIAAEGSDERAQALRVYAEALGLAFQIQDDILNSEGDEAELGKTIGSDAAKGKATFVTLGDLEGARALLRSLGETAKSAVGVFEGSAFLHFLVDILEVRRK